MKVYTTKQIRNVALAGHSSAGKTSLAEAMLYLAKHIPRMGKTEDGNTASDFLPEEISRGISISCSLLPVEMGDVKANVVDLPGFRDFIGEIRNGMSVCGSLAVVIDALGGVEVGTEFALDVARDLGLPVAFFINKLDKENASYEGAMANLAESLPHDRFLPLTIPLGEGPNFSGVIDVVNMRAMIPGKDGKIVAAEIPADMAEAAAEARQAVMDEAGAADDELMGKFLEGIELTSEEVLRGLREAFIARSFHPVFVGSATKALGVQSLMNFISVTFPNPLESYGAHMCDRESGEAVDDLKHDENGPVVLNVYKTLSDRFGTSSFVHVVSGTLRKDAHLTNLTNGRDERVAHVYAQRGKGHEEVEELHAGDLGVLLKLANTHTNETLGPADMASRVRPPKYPMQTVRMAIHAKDQAAEDKLGTLLHKLCAQDPTLSAKRDPELHQTIVGGMGDMHLDVVLERAKGEKIEATLEVPRTPYRETTRKKAAGSYRHKKQSGGKGQFGEVHLRVMPSERGEGLDFEWKIVGGVIPTKYEPSVRKGVEAAMARGVIAGYPVVDMRVECFDGKQHDVDSSDMAFQIASSMCFQQVAREADPILLEPIYTLRVAVPEQYMGDVMGSLTAKRGRIMSQDLDGGKARIEAHVPLAEMYEYSRELRSMTQGRGVFEIEYDHYAQVPGDVQAKLVAAHAANGHGHGHGHDH